MKHHNKKLPTLNTKSSLLTALINKAKQQATQTEEGIKIFNQESNAAQLWKNTEFENVIKELESDLDGLEFDLKRDGTALISMKNLLDLRNSYHSNIWSSKVIYRTHVMNLICDTDPNK